VRLHGSRQGDQARHHRDQGSRGGRGRRCPAPWIIGGALPVERGTNRLERHRAAVTQYEKPAIVR